ncbi:MAG: hypothetical protein L0287_16695 [Anaerolineae bacterium]|nr:hypothetical protein [Anaerolineae bacterium]MCI0610959.1 hypothetical protein [Anaerolineae bacterium]
MRHSVIDELLTYLFDGQSHLLAAPMGTWLASSRRFTAFVNTHHTKIRKKLRVAQGKENLRDLQLELETAYLLLREQSLSLEYESQHPELGRSPDFAVTFTTSLVFMVEVTRLRSPGPRTPNTTLPGDRFTDMLCSKLGQLLPQRSNLLIVGVETPHLTHSDILASMLRIQQRAEGNDSNVVHKHGFRDRADFFQHYQRLSALLVRGGTPLQAGEPVVIWVNPQAKYPLTARVRTALSRSHTL